MPILLAEDHELVRDSIAGFIRRMTGFLVEPVGDLPSACDAVEVNGRFDLVLRDDQMPGMSGLDGLPDMVARQQGKPVAILSGSMPASLVEEVFRSGAAGYLPKTMTTNPLIPSLRLILAGEKYAPPSFIMHPHRATPSSALPMLSQRETDVLREGCLGLTNNEIAKLLGVHETTVKVHVKSICSKVNGRNRTHASVIARNAGFRQARAFKSLRQGKGMEHNGKRPSISVTLAGLRARLGLPSFRDRM